MYRLNTDFGGAVAAWLEDELCGVADAGGDAAGLLPPHAVARRAAPARAGRGKYLF